MTLLVVTLVQRHRRRAESDQVDLRLTLLLLLSAVTRDLLAWKERLELVLHGWELDVHGRISEISSFSEMCG